MVLRNIIFPLPNCKFERNAAARLKATFSALLLFEVYKSSLMGVFMLSSTQQRKAKITLTDYSYLQDIEIRILMAQLTVFEVNVLREIVHHSLKISIDQLANELNISVEVLIPILDKLSASKLFKRIHLMLFVDKEMRKYVEFQLEKFDNHFEPDLEFLQNVLNQVPIHVLPLWYAIPRSSNHIFSSIIEKYFSTPKIYLQYLSELQFDNPILNAMIKDVYQAPHFKVSAADLMAKYELTRRSFEEYLLLLEYHFACCLSYNQVNDAWHEVVTPFSELREFLKFESQAKAYAIKGKIEKTHDSDFSFMEDLTTVIKAGQTKKVHPKEVKNLIAKNSLQLKRLAEKLVRVEFAKQSANGQLIATAKGKAWIAKTPAEKIALFAADPLNTLSNHEEFAPLWNTRNLYLIEKKLRKLTPHEWIDIDLFITGFIAPINDKEPVTLKKKGKKWKYEVPTYSDIEKQFIRQVIMERLAELGVVDTGTHQGKTLFCLTSFGSHFIH